RFKVDDMDKGDRAKLLQLMEERPAVEEWRATLTDWERRNFNNPTIVWRKWTAATREKKPKKRTGAVSAHDHGGAQATIEQLQARITEVTEELAQAREGNIEKPEPTAEQGEGKDQGASVSVKELTQKLDPILKALKIESKKKVAGL